MKLLDLEQNKIYVPILSGQVVDFNNLNAVKIVNNEVFIRDLEGQWFSTIELAKCGSDITLKYINQFDYVPLYGRTRFAMELADKEVVVKTETGEQLMVASNYDSYNGLCDGKNAIYLEWGNKFDGISFEEFDKIIEFVNDLRKCKEEEATCQ